MNWWWCQRLVTIGCWVSWWQTREESSEAKSVTRRNLNFLTICCIKLLYLKMLMRPSSWCLWEQRGWVMPDMAGLVQTEQINWRGSRSFWQLEQMY